MLDNLLGEISIKNVMRSVYIEVDKRMKKINFSSLWLKFHPYEFALYNKECICLRNETIDWEDSFVRNTAIVYQDSYRL